MAQEKGCVKLSSSNGSGAVDCGYPGQTLCFGAESNQFGHLSWRQSCCAKLARVLYLVCHPCFCPPVRSSTTEQAGQELVQRIAQMEEHMNTAVQSIPDAGLRAQAAENRARAAETAAKAAEAGAAVSRQDTAPNILEDTRLLGKPRRFSGALAC